MAVFVDTSALYAALSATDDNHVSAQGAWEELRHRREQLFTTNYILVESMTLLASRFGLQAMRDFQTDFVPLLHVVWVDEFLHRQAVTALLTAGRRDFSLVDCVSFQAMRQQSLTTVFAFDAHFAQQGFHCIPSR